MRPRYFVSVVLALALGVAVATAQDRAATTPPATDQAAAATVSPCQAIMDKAAAAGKYVFIFFWKENNQQTEQGWRVFELAAKEMADSADLISIKASSQAEQQIINRYGVSRAPMPMVLAVAPCGAVTKAFTKAFDEKQLRTAFVSPCTAECMKALQARKLVLLCVERVPPKVRQVSLQQGVQNFTTDPQYAGRSAVVILDTNDPAETRFLGDLRIDPRTPDRVTVLMSPPGTVIGTFAGDVTEEQIVAKIKAAQSGCGPNCSCHRH